MSALLPDDDALRHRLRAPLTAVRSFTAGAPPAPHPARELLLAHAGNELDVEEAIGVTRHLALCADGSCAAVVRDAVAGAAVARAALFARRDEVTDPTLAVAEPPASHSFACPEPLWDAFETLARQEGASVDAMLADAMKAYMRERAGAISFPGPRAVVMDAAWGAPRERNTPTVQRSYLPRAPASTRRISLGNASTPPQSLAVVVAGRRYEVTKEPFVVGRGGTASDLAIDDPGVSRQHAVIERGPGGAFVLVDMGSTNGVEFQGKRIARKEIVDGDRVRIGDAELEFVLA